MTLEEEKAQARATETLDCIKELRACPGFEKYWMRRLRERRDKLAAEILESDKLTTEEREQKRAVWKEYSALLKMMREDESVAAGVLGIKPN